MKFPPCFLESIIHPSLVYLESVIILFPFYFPPPFEGEQGINLTFFVTRRITPNYLRPPHRRREYLRKMFHPCLRLIAGVFTIMSRKSQQRGGL